MSVFVIADMICIELLMRSVAEVIASRRQPFTHNVSTGCRLISLGILLLIIVRRRAGLRVFGAGMRDSRDQFNSIGRL